MMAFQTFHSKEKLSRVIVNLLVKLNYMYPCYIVHQFDKLHFKGKNKQKEGATALKLIMYR